MKAVAYYRVSTQRQGRSGLGLDAQREAVKAFLAGKGWPPVAEFTEVESGSNNERPKLEEAKEACRLYGATLVIAKLDRLSRNAAFLLNLRDSGVDFVAADMPDANRLTVGIMAIIAEDERERISARTKSALAQAKARGTILGGYRGGPMPTSAYRVKAQAVKAKRAANFAANLAPTLTALEAEGLSLNAIARRLNERGIPTRRGGEWQAVQVRRALDRVAALD